MVKRKQSEITPDCDLDFSQWELQDRIRAPPISSAFSIASPELWLGVQSLASIATSRDGKVFVENAISKRGLKFQLGFVGKNTNKKTHIVMPRDAPHVVARLFSQKLAIKVLNTPSFLAKLEEAGAPGAEVSEIISEVLEELQVFTATELEALKTFRSICGAEENFPIRGGHVSGKLHSSRCRSNNYKKC